MTITNSLTLFQKRTISIIIEIVDNEQPYTLSVGENLHFGVKKRLSSTSYAIEKTIDVDDYMQPGKYRCKLTTTDTNVNSGYYYYDVSLNRINGDVECVIPCTECVIIDSITE